VQIQYIGHAGWVFETPKTKLLCDPWINPQGTFYSSWFQFPRNDHIDIESLLDADAVYVSHAHADHYDPWFLSKLNKNIPFYICNFHDPYLKKSLENLGFTNIIEIENSESTYINDLKITIFCVEDYFDKDSCILLEHNNHKVMNLNDCFLNEDIEKAVGRVDVLMAQFSGAIWWPCVYDYSPEKMKELGTFKRKRNMVRCANYGANMQPSFFLPCAGPPAFLDESLEVWNDYTREETNPFPMMPSGVEYIHSLGYNALLSMPGDVYHLNNSDLSLQERTLDPKTVYSNVREYIEEYKKDRKRIIAEHLNSYNKGKKAAFLLQRKIKMAIKRSMVYKQKIDYPFLISLTGSETSEWLVDFRSEDIIRPYNGEQWRYKLEWDADLLADQLDRKMIDLDYYFLSCRFKASRNPDEFDELLFAFFKNLDATRMQISEFLYLNKEISKDTFNIKCNNREYKVQKYCPHMGADLSKIGHCTKDNHIVCGLHGWKFDLQTGDCTNITNQSIEVEQISEDA